MKKFIINLISFFSIIFIIITFIAILYVKRDVYLDFGYHKNYSWKYYFQQMGDISTKKILISKTKYNSFIFGSSRSTAFHACYLQKKISNSCFFHYANWNDPIGGIYAKLKFVDSLGYEVKNVLMCFDTDCTFAGDGNCFSSDHYLLTNENKYRYLFNHFIGFVSTLDIDKIKILLGLKVEGQIFPNWESDPITNDGKHICSDSILNHYGDKDSGNELISKVDSLKSSGFLYKRTEKQGFREKQISVYEEELLNKIKAIFQKHHTKYYVVITPLYEQLKFEKSDMQTVREIFGENVYDFSGINKYTNDVYNYPDRIHFQQYISKEIIDSIIEKDTINFY